MEKQEKIELAKYVFEEEIRILDHIKNNLDMHFVEIEEEIMACKGRVIICGMGKSGHIAKKIAATLSSLGTPSFFLHPAEALHGDLGMVSEEDVVVLISNSGETEEVIRLLPSLKMIGAKLIAITGNHDSTLAKACEKGQILDIQKEACILNLAPTSSTTATLVYGDALAVVASSDSGFDKTDFGIFHPAGTLGKRVLLKVEDVMAKEDDIPCVKNGCKITDAIIEMSRKGLGVLAVCDGEDKLVGILTDGDLRRAIEKKEDLYGDIIDTIMTADPKYIEKEILLVDALQRLKKSHLNNYPVVDGERRVIGMLTWQMIVRERIIL